jgi:hypothetical protein
MDVDEEGIVFSDVRERSGRRQVKGATLKKLVERVTDPQVSGMFARNAKGKKKKKKEKN